MYLCAWQNLFHSKRRVEDEHTVNYAAVAKLAARVCRETKAYTLEALAAQLARATLLSAGCERVRRVRVRLDKPDAMRLGKPAVSVEREREFFLDEERRFGKPAAPVLEYDYHLDAVNTVTFVDEARRIVTTSDDKKILVWEYGAPVPIKYIADPSMYAVPTVTLHPSGEALACQSMDNNVVVYSAGDRVALNRKKHFSGHVTAGYACQLAFSPDGRHLASGDGEGQLWFWDWRSGKFEKKLRAHAGGPAIGAVWHPLKPSTMATCGWDGLVQLWE
jgi:WD40 repeat protein